MVGILAWKLSKHSARNGKEKKKKREWQEDLIKLIYNSIN